MPTTGLTSFRMRLLLGVLIPVLLIQSAGILYETLTLRETYLSALRSEAKMAARLLGDAMAKPLWDFDTAQVARMLASAVNEGRVGSGIVVDTTGGIIAETQAEGYVPDGSDVQSAHYIFHKVDGRNEMLGLLQIRLPAAAAMEALHTAVLSKLLISAAVTALIGTAVFLVLSRIARPLAAFAATIDKLRRGELDCRVPGLGRTDEIGVMALALDQLRRNEIEVQDLRAENDEHTRRESKRIRRALESTRDGVLLAGEDGRIVFCNPNAAVLFGDAQPGDALDFKSWLPAGAAWQIQSSLLQHDDFSVEAEVVQQNTGEQLNLLVRGGPIRDEDGSLLGTVLLGTDHSEQARQAARARFLADHDSLTGLPNRRLMEETLERWLQAEGGEVSILLADLDQFKLINDTLGHPAGDALLKTVAQKFKSCTGSSILAARLGGDEFAILVRGKGSLDRIYAIAQHLVTEMAKPQLVDGNELHTGMSAGIATLSGKDAQAAEGVRRADLALYEAKNGGRGRVEVFQDNLETAIRRKALLERELRTALTSGEVYPVFQMQTDLQTGEIIGFESLARWQHPEMGFISPGEFIPVAEECGLIRDLTRQILLSACAAAAQWRAAGFEGRVAVNLSPKLFGTRVDEFVADCLYEANCPATAIEAEITETVVLSNGNAALREITGLQQLGVTVALDDFGMGYSSLSYLQKFPVDKIKVDSAFVSKLPESAETRAIVIAIAELGHALGMEVTGEGAETEQHRRLLRDCKVDYLQGYVDGYPLSEAQASALVAGQRSAAPRRLG